MTSSKTNLKLKLMTSTGTGTCSHKLAPGSLNKMKKNKSPCLSCRGQHIKCDGKYPCNACKSSVEKARACCPTKPSRAHSQNKMNVSLNAQISTSQTRTSAMANNFVPPPASKISLHAPSFSNTSIDNVRGSSQADPMPQALPNVQQSALFFRSSGQWCNDMHTTTLPFPEFNFNLFGSVPAKVKPAYLDVDDVQRKQVMDGDMHSVGVSPNLHKYTTHRVNEETQSQSFHYPESNYQQMLGNSPGPSIGQTMWPSEGQYSFDDQNYAFAGNQLGSMM
ncbi:hypothetical protein SCHPADRAFT_928505 [Schizopora paradoxa]|uniref:Zn(2)-C6 fungal-type domain-containing protein n=1 Tax=Schizopora paradoxa TaxID=27342 RepID=A0A0H2RVK5_9AGAM|nr:hypothetical protein SCHPADRAFT_928505 [Schizopora paradoxa]